MNSTNRSSFIWKKLIFFLIYILFLCLLAETASRGYWSASRRMYYFDPEILIHGFYPELKKIKKKQIQKDNDRFDILLLGGSVLTKRHGNIKSILLEELTYKTKKNIKIFNLSVGAHTSLDSYHKYKRLSNKSFDLVLVYHGINEVRTNNCPPTTFKKDYSHYHWYKTLNQLEEYDKFGFITFPFSFYYLSVKTREALGFIQLVPMDGISPELAAYGHNVKTGDPFRENLLKILDIAKSKDEPVLLMSYAFYIPEGYTMEKFKNKVLDYTLHQGEVEIWGKPDNVIKGISMHNQVIEKLAQKHKNTYFIDQNKLIPKDGKYFNDICHLTTKGSQRFVANILDIIIEIMKKKKE
jgi:hypothetical protein